MPKITFMGAGSTVFAKSVLGDSLLSPALCDAHIALYDIDGERLRDSKLMLDTLNANINQGRARVKTYLGVASRKEALRGANERFIARFGYIEQRLREQGRDLQSAGLAEMDALWNEAKQQE